MKISPPDCYAFAFGPFRLIPSRNILLRKDQPVKLGGRALDILHLLVLRAGEEVSKDALIEFAWPNMFVVEPNLKVVISGVRRALGDTLPQPTYIATVPGHGYQFVAQVQAEQVESVTLQANDLLTMRTLPQASHLVGREDDVGSVTHALDFARLVTLTGPGGVGKTSLAIAVAQARSHEFPEGVYFVDFSATTDPALVPQLVATCLGFRTNDADLIKAVVTHLQNRRVLIVLDNCEHVLHAVAAMVSRLVEAKVSACLLATSREPLAVNSEDLHRVGHLPFPRQILVRGADAALAYPAIELFALRALEKADYHLVDDDAQAIASLCEALDGLPLAIEIVASKLDQFSPTELLASVGQRLGSLRNDQDIAHPRHQTLWATLDWSYQLLSTEEATILRLVSVFAGTFEWADVDGMARLVRYDAYQITVALGCLVAKSLLLPEISGEQLRYRLLESTRCYAAENLLKDPLNRAAQYQHAHLVLSLFERAEAEWSKVEISVWRARYEGRTGDLRKALDWCFADRGDASLGVNLVVLALRLWDEQSCIVEQLLQVDRALQHCTAVADGPRRRAALATSRAWSMTLARRLHAETDEAWMTALKFAELSGDGTLQVAVLCGQAVFLVYTGRHQQAVNLMVDLTRKASQSVDRATVFEGERLRASAELQLGKLLDVRETLEKLAEDLAQGLSPSKVSRFHLQRYVGIHTTLSFSTWLTGRPERGLAMAEEMVQKTGQSTQRMGQAHILSLFAIPLALLSGRMDVFQRYVITLRANLDCGHMAIWEPAYQFYSSVHRLAEGDSNALEQMRSAVDELIRDRLLLRTPMYLGFLAEAHLAKGNIFGADEAVEYALTLQSQCEEVWCQPELLRVKAQIKTATGDRGEACELLARARENALTMGARSLELRIVNDMAQIAIGEGRPERAIDLLGPIYAGFVDKTATEDLKRSTRLFALASSSLTPSALLSLPLQD